MIDHTTQNTLEILRSVNIERSEKAFGHKLNAWSPAQWSNAMAGEAGETVEVLNDLLSMAVHAGRACNITKKYERGDYDENDGTGYDQTDHIRFQEDLGKELADVIIYADLLAARCGINLCVAIRRKFNEVSDRRSCDIKIPV